MFCSDTCSKECAVMLEEMMPSWRCSWFSPASCSELVLLAGTSDFPSDWLLLCISNPQQTFLTLSAASVGPEVLQQFDRQSDETGRLLNHQGICCELYYSEQYQQSRDSFSRAAGFFCRTVIGTVLAMSASARTAYTFELHSRLFRAAAPTCCQESACPLLLAGAPSGGSQNLARPTSSGVQSASTAAD